MVFSSVTFLIFFLPCILVLYYSLPRTFRGTRNVVLLIFSLGFYAWGGPKFLPLLLASAAINYACGLLAGGGRAYASRKVAVIAAAVLNLWLLGWFKYAGFFAEILVSLGAHISVPEIVLPIGISFFTFQGLSYVLDVYRGDAKAQKNPLNVALYISFFPQLVAGPIVRYITVAEDIENRRESAQQFTDGLVCFLFGLGKKMLLANAMGEIADAVFENAIFELSTATAWAGALSYTAQIYFDFSAYSDMAIGLGAMFGFKFPPNFNYPYISQSITEFWRRWHISLSTWFRDYVYIPLGGNRCSKAKHIRNIAVVWLLTGLWHGADWTYVFWGALFAFFILGEKFVWGNALKKLPRALRHVYTMLVVILSWVIFRSGSLAYAFSYIGVMFGAGSRGFWGEAVYYLLQYLPEIICCIVASLPVRPAAESFLIKRQENPLCRLTLEWAPKLIALSLLALSYLKLVTGSFNPFIYFQF